MSLQIFKERIPPDILFVLLEDLCVKTDKYFIINTISYKKGIFTEKINDFLNTCKQYYFLSLIFKESLKCRY